MTGRAEPGSGEASNRGDAFDTSVAHPARVYDYLLGGKDNFPADREAAERVLKAMPSMRELARANRLFLATAVHHLVEAGVRQFLDIGTGLPAANNTHEVAQRAAPEARIVYVDNDPIVLAHAQALLTSTPEGRCDYLDADAREPEKILAEAARTLDFGQPVAVIMLAILHFIPDDEDPCGIIGRLMAAIPSGSYLVVSHAASDIRSDASAAAARGYNANAAAALSTRPRAEVGRFFDGLELLPPGLVPLGQWLPGAPASTCSTATAFPCWSGLARKS